MTSALEPESVLATLESANRLLVQQVFRPIGNEYRISVPAAASTDETTPILYEAEEAQHQGGHPLPAVAGREGSPSS